MDRKIGVIGLGYVGLPVAVSFGRKSKVIGFDINHKRIADLKSGNDRNLEVDSKELRECDIEFTDSIEELKAADFFIVTVPTPIDDANRPDFSALLAASETVGKALKKGDIVVYESTVYPGLTEESCLPVLEQVSGLKGGIDFKVGYSPERINPGDKVHRFESIKKVVAGQDEESLNIIADTYGSVVTAGIYRARNIQTAEAAKVIENTQRDLNIALINEIALICEKMNLDTLDVLEAAGTKWNFLPFRPGLVGGHCIGVDPYYLTYRAEQIGYIPQVILAGRRVNDSMGSFIAQSVVKRLVKSHQNLSEINVNVLGITFKEECPDIRNSKTIDIINELQDYGINVDVYDPMADSKETQEEYGFSLKKWEDLKPAHAVIVAVAHNAFKELKPDDFQRLSIGKGIVADVKGILNRNAFASSNLQLWRL